MVQRVEDRVSSMQPEKEGRFGVVVVIKGDAFASTRVEPRKSSFVPNRWIRGGSFFMDSIRRVFYRIYPAINHNQYNYF